MGLKKNSPGCDCCQGRVLIWDVGHKTSSTVYGFLYDSATNIFPSLFGESPAAVHYAIPPGIIPPPAPGSDFWDSNPGYSPYDDHSTLENFWTRNIFDYQLIVWVFPADDSDLDSATGACPVQCPPPPFSSPITECGEPDHEFFGGQPEWWDDVASGKWVGRVFIISEANTPALGVDPGEGYPTNVFLNTLTSVTGMSIDLEAAARFQNSTQPFQSVASDLTDGVPNFTESSTFAPVTGGEDVFVAGSWERLPGPFCTWDNVSSIVVSAAMCQRNTITVEVDDVDYLKDFVIMPNINRFRLPFVADSVPNFFVNLFESSISNDHSLPDP